MQKNLLSNLAPRATREQDTQLLKKINKPNASKIVRGGGIQGTVETIRAEVAKKLSIYANKVSIIRDEKSLIDYIDACIRNGIISIDTETSGLDVLVDKIIGYCFYTPGEKAAYIPVKHISYITGVKLNNQLSDAFIISQFERLINAKVKIIMHNGKFDKRIIKSNIGSDLSVYWDTMLAAKVLNGLEPANLKYQYATHILHESKTYDFNKLFGDIDYCKIPVDTAALYAATDALITYELYEYQIEEFKKYPSLYSVFFDIEMPLLEVVCSMEDTGVLLDIEYAKELSVKYHQELKQAENEVNKELMLINDKINLYIVSHSDKKLTQPINISSPTQLAILFYDILQVGIIDKKAPRGTGVDILKKLGTPLCNAILKVREINKLLTTYIDKLPEVINQKTKKIHANFNQIGADTGRFSSSDPNLQNIPSRNKDIRKMFVAGPGNLFVGMDLSQQEPRTLADFSKDIHMMQLAKEGKDIYAAVASKVFHVKYEDCLEFYPKGTSITVKGQTIICGHKTNVNKDGKKRRDSTKSILLGLMYGRGAKSIAEQAGCTIKDAQKIIDDFFREFPDVKKWMDKTEADAKINGYVETMWGRRRPIPDMALEPYEFKVKLGVSKNFNPLLFEEQDTENELSKEEKDDYISQLEKCWRYTDREAIYARAAKLGITIKDNTGFIEDARRQCVNTRIQGSAADMVKKAMILIYNNERLRKLGFKLVLQIHDELIGVCKEEVAYECCQIASKLMIEAPMDKMTVPMKCDTSFCREWYGDEINIDSLKHCA